MSWLIVRVRSDVKVERSIKETMHFLNLTKVNLDLLRVLKMALIIKNQTK